MVCAAVKLTQRPTAVGHCAVAYLTHPIGRRPAEGVDRAEVELYGGDLPAEEPAQQRLPELVVTKGNTVEVFRVLLASPEQQAHLHAAAAGTPGMRQASASVDASKLMGGIASAKLELVLRESFSGTLVDLSVLRRHTGTDRTTRDALVLAFETAKVSVLDYDPDSNGLRVSSLHGLEGDELTSGRSQYVPAAALRADPKGRCVAALVHGTHIAVLRGDNDIFDEGEEGDEEEEDGGSRNSGAAIVASSYVIQLSTLGIKSVRDLAFLHGYAEPVLAVLHEEQLFGIVFFKKVRHDVGILRRRDHGPVAASSQDRQGLSPVSLFRN